jgi:hypothetical protein
LKLLRRGHEKEERSREEERKREENTKSEGLGLRL